MTDLKWQERGVCRVEKIDPVVFYPPRSKLNARRPAKGEETSESYRMAFAPAKTYCERCPVEADCLEYALANGEDHGYWGNTTPPERRRIKRRRRKLAATAAQAASQGLVGATGS